MGRQLTTEDFKQRLYQLVQEEYRVLGEYQRANQKIQLYHLKCGQHYEVRPNSFLRGKRCPYCAPKGRRKKTTYEFRLEVEELGQNEYEVLGEYQGAKQKIQMRHRLCGCCYEVQPDAFLKGRRCPQCYKRSVRKP